VISSKVDIYLVGSTVWSLMNPGEPYPWLERHDWAGEKSGVKQWLGQKPYKFSGLHMEKGYSSKLCKLVKRCLAYNPDDRPELKFLRRETKLSMEYWNSDNAPKRKRGRFWLFPRVDDKFAVGKTLGEG